MDAPSFLDGGDRTGSTISPLHSRHVGSEETGDRRERLPRLPRHEAARAARRHRPGAGSTAALDGLDVEYHYGDVFDDDALRTAMSGVDDVFYCVVDTRAWLRDPTPLFRTNVQGLQHVLDAAADAELRRFVFTSSIGTIGIPGDDHPATEDDAMNWAGKGGGYIQSRVDAENLVLRYAAEHGLPAVVLCVANTYGPGDFQPTSHGALLASAAAGKMPVYVKGTASEVVGIEDAATALLLAAEKGRNGERYIVSERFITARELYEAAAAAGGSRPPRFGFRWASCT
jgi:dihydroflavonol-4-reductase